MGVQGFGEMPVYVVVNDGDVGEPDQPLGSLLNFFQSMLSDPHRSVAAAGEEDRPYVLVVEGSLQVTGAVFVGSGNCRSSLYRFLPACTSVPGFEDADGGTHLRFTHFSGRATMATVSPACRKGGRVILVSLRREIREFGGIIGCRK